MMNHILPIRKSIPSQIQVNMLFNVKDKINRSIFDIKIHNAMRIPVKIYKTNKKFTVTV